MFSPKSTRILLFLGRIEDSFETVFKIYSTPMNYATNKEHISDVYLQNPVPIFLIQG